MKEEFYYALQATLDTVARRDFIILMGDFNAKTGKESDVWRNNLEKFGAGDCNDNGKRLLKMCCNNSLCITNTHFKQKSAHRNTWQSPDDKTCNLMDYIITRNERLTSFCNTRVFRGAEIHSDHYLVVSEIKIKLAAVRTKNKTRRFDDSKLTVEAIRPDIEITIGS